MSKDIFRVDPEVWGPKHGYQRDRNPFINNRTGYTLDTDLLDGFNKAVDSNQNNLALQYAKVVFELLAELLTEDETKEALPPSKPARSTVKATADTE